MIILGGHIGSSPSAVATTHTWPATRRTFPADATKTADRTRPPQCRCRLSVRVLRAMRAVAESKSRKNDLHFHGQARASIPRSPHFVPRKLRSARRPLHYSWVGGDFDTARGRRFLTTLGSTLEKMSEISPHGHEAVESRSCLPGLPRVRS